MSIGQDTQGAILLRSQAAALQLQELCNHAALIINPFANDRTGKDFLVEIPPEPTNVSLDARKMLPAIHVQVKSTVSNRIRLKLSTAEYLAKSSNPAFIFVALFNRDNQHIENRLLHVDEIITARILKALRRAHADKIDASKRSVVLTSNQGPVVEAPANLYSIFTLDGRLEAAEYAIRKTDWIRKTGFEPDNRYLGQLSIVAENEDELFDGLLGLRSLKASQFRLDENRFSILLPLFEHIAAEDLSDAGTIRFEPHPAAQATLRITGRNSGKFAELSGDITLPAMTSSKKRFLFRNAFCSTKFVENSGGAIDAEFSFTLNSEQRHELFDLHQAIVLTTVVDSEPCSFELIYEGVSCVKCNEFRFQSEGSKAWARVAARIEIICDLVSRYSENSILRLSVKEIAELHVDVVRYLKALSSMPSAFTAKFQISRAEAQSRNVTEEDLKQAIFFTELQIGESNVICISLASAKPELLDDIYQVCLKVVRPIELLIDMDAEQFSRRKAEILKMLGVKLFVDLPQNAITTSSDTEEFGEAG